MLDQLWAGWRQSFIEGGGAQRDASGCVLCFLGASKETSLANFVLYRGEFNYVVLNAYPYAPGHMMVVPYLHLAELMELREEAWRENAMLLRKCVAALGEAYQPGGYNVGANLGRAGGAAFDDHIHFHVVPRWIGDTNFMTSVASMRVMPESLPSAYRRLYPHFSTSLEVPEARTSRD